MKKRDMERLAELAEAIAEGISLQTECDNIGDGESLILREPYPVINVVQLAEHIARWLAVADSKRGCA